jgi:hypothetical protein
MSDMLKKRPKGYKSKNMSVLKMVAMSLDGNTRVFILFGGALGTPTKIGWDNLLHYPLRCQPGYVEQNTLPELADIAKRVAGVAFVILKFLDYCVLKSCHGSIWRSRRCLSFLGFRSGPIVSRFPVARMGYIGARALYPCLRNRRRS